MTDLELRATLDAAMRARLSEDWEVAIRLCRVVLENVGSDRRLRAITLNEMGHDYRFMGHSREAEECFLGALAIKGSYELASLGLYFSLTDQGRWAEAIKEAIRFLELRDSNDYREIVEGLVKTLGPGHLRALAHKAAEVIKRHDRTPKA